MSNLMTKLGWRATFIADPRTIDGMTSELARPRHGRVVVFDDVQAHRRSGVEQLA